MLHQMDEPESESVTLLSLACDLGAVLRDAHLAAVVGQIRLFARLDSLESRSQIFTVFRVNKGFNKFGMNV